ncbi:MAG: hypothetical protein JW925_14360 [Syntrophaceae bacterium]|nr:hypothetical protein [Syntrophaceae bacterium]
MPVPDLTSLTVINERFKADFNAFFKDKYEEDVLEVIYNDLNFYIREGYVEKIFFCYYNANEEAITGGYSYSFSDGTITDPVDREIKPVDNIPELSGGTEKILTLQLNDDFMTQTKEERDNFFAGLTLQWSDIINPEIKNDGAEQHFYDSQEIQIRRGGIKRTKG